MRRRVSGWILIAAFLAAVPAVAQQMYQWIDENGVRRYSNQPPPDTAREVKKMDEVPHDAEADRLRMERDRKAMEEMAEQQRQRRLEREAAEQRAREERERREARQKQQALEEKVQDLESELEKEKRRNRGGYWYRPYRPPVAVPLPESSNRPGHHPGYQPSPRPSGGGGSGVAGF